MDGMTQGMPVGQQSTRYVCPGPKIGRTEHGACPNKNMVRKVPPIKIMPGVVARPAVYCDHCGSELALYRG